MTSTRSEALDLDDDDTPTSVPHPERRTLVNTIALTVVVAGSAILAMSLHRNGHTTGDDFALYLRQARSLFDGDVGQVVADNRFTVISSGGAFSPIAYPWGWPLLLSPFVHLWGYDYDRLKLLEVACFCVWLVLAHGIVRRRAGRLVAICVVAVVGTAPVLLLHTDQLLSEYPHAAMVAAFIWWMDRIKVRRPAAGRADGPARRARRDRRGGVQHPAGGGDPRRRHRRGARLGAADGPPARRRGADPLEDGGDAVRRVLRVDHLLPAAAAVDADARQRRQPVVRARPDG